MANESSRIAQSPDAVSLAPSYFLLVWLSVTMFLWAFAFWHSPGPTPDWLLRAQAACFGRTETGLPDARGWIMLTLAPLLLLGCFLAAFYREISEGMPIAMTQRGFRRMLLSVFLLLSVESIWIGRRIALAQSISSADFKSVELGQLPAEYPLQYTFPTFALTDQHGKRVSPEDFPRKVLIVTFAFAHCTTICPALVQTAARAQATLGPDQAELLIVTLDPWRDTIRSLPTLAEGWGLGPSQHVLSGEVDDVQSALKAYGVAAERNTKTGDIVHPGLVYVIGAGGKSGYLFNNPSPRWIVDAAKRLMLRANDGT